MRYINHCYILFWQFSSVTIIRENTDKNGKTHLFGPTKWTSMQAVLEFDEHCRVWSLQLCYWNFDGKKNLPPSSPLPTPEFLLSSYATRYRRHASSRGRADNILLWAYTCDPSKVRSRCQVNAHNAADGAWHYLTCAHTCSLPAERGKTRAISAVAAADNDK